MVIYLQTLHRFGLMIFIEQTSFGMILIASKKSFNGGVLVHTGTAITAITTMLLQHNFESSVLGRGLANVQFAQTF